MKHLLLLAALLCTLSGHLLAAERPNIITVFIDDMGWTDLSCFGGKITRTEHIDRLAAEGIKFTNFYVNSPICSPSRVALTTGQYPQRWRITSYLNNRNSNNKRGMAQWLDLKAPSLARELKKNGYATGHFGKWHMGGQRDVDDAPAISEYGFDRSLTNFEGMGAKLLPLTMQPGWKKPGKIWANATRLGEPVTWMQRSHITKGFVGAALTFIDESQKKNKPFFVNVWPDDVHSPFFPPLDKWGDGKRALYYGVLDAMDEQLAPLFDRIRNDEKLNNNTLIIVASDNGHEPGAGMSDPLRGAKTWLYEGGIRSPLIVWGPGMLAKDAVGRTNDDAILCALDLNRSLYGLTGTPLPEDVRLDGEDLRATLLGATRTGRRTPIFWRRPPDRPGFGHGLDEDNPDLAVRDGKWKFLVNYDGSDPQLYHLNKDAGERHNLAANFPEVTKRLRAKVEQWNKSLPQDAGNPTRKADAALPTTHFVNPIGEGADPWIVRDGKNKRYLWCLSEGNRAIAIHTSDNLSSLGEKHVVWRAPEKGPYSKEIWAPELHFLDGHWHIYFAGSDGKNANHLAYVLRSRTDDPLGEYELHGPLATGDGADGRSPNLWAIDMTPLRHKGKLYALWSGWDGAGTDRQLLYLASMKSPTALAGPRVRICSNDDFRWEFTETEGKGRGLNEGPQVLQTGNRTLVLYSCGASWLPTYKLGMLELVGDNPLDPKAWKKHEKPVFTGTGQTYGIGHSCFVKSPDASEWWHIFHAKRDRQPGWRRTIFAQPMKIGKDGYPAFGRPVAAGEVLRRPRGEKTTILARRHHTSSLQSNDHNRIWCYFGHHQFYGHTKEGLHLGRTPANPINDYRSGEKVVLNHEAPSDLNVEVTIDFLGNRDARDGGLLFRTSGASVGFDAQRGYFAGLIPRTNLVILGKTDGTKWNELARKESPINPDHRQKLGVTMVGSKIVITHNGAPAIVHTDSTFATGTVGLRVVNTHAVFSELHLKSGSTGPEARQLEP